MSVFVCLYVIMLFHEQGLLPFLLSYAVAFNAVPAARWLFNKRENA